MEELKELIKEGRLPISLANINLVSTNGDKRTREIIGDISMDADLTIVGFRQEQLSAEGYKLFTGFNKLGNVLFVSANKKKEIN
jgi:predicted HAD superfamily phosphohydrolase YqeG